MNTTEEFACRGISEGHAEGEVIVSQDAVCFYLVEPDTGEVIEENHDLYGKNIAGKVLVMPAGKGSSVVQGDGLYKLMIHGKQPSAIVVAQPDPVLVSGVVVMEIPMVDRVDPAFYEAVADGDRVLVDAVAGKLTVRH
ncbi:MAG: DUF126 domain-containing protein [Thermoleophilia bacterium]